MTARPLAESVDPGWARALAPVETNVAAMGDFLRAELAAGKHYLPAGESVLRAFRYPFDRVRVLIVGQDPYPTPGHAVGLSFSVAPDVRPVPRSLANIFKEYSDDLGLPTPSNGDLTPWAEQGVMLLNRVLTVEPSAAASHRKKGWEAVTEQAYPVWGVRLASWRPVATLQTRTAPSYPLVTNTRPSRLQPASCTPAEWSPTE